MSDYIDGKIRPEPGRPIHPITMTETIRTEVQSPVDINAIANAVVAALEKKMPQGRMAGRSNTNEEIREEYDDKKSLESMADAMIVQRGKNEANFGDLGVVKKTKKNIKQTNETIDLLKDLD